MGFGDVKLFASLGLALGVTGTVATLIGASMLSGIFAAVGLASGRYKKDDTRPRPVHMRLRFVLHFRGMAFPAVRGESLSGEIIGII